MAGRSESASVNWRAVDSELANVPDEYKDPKFYALKHVVEILTSNNPQAMVSQLRDQEQRLATLVDTLVQGYHSGFAKSIQNYSQILQLFGDSKEQVDGLKKALADASRQLSAQSRSLQQQWRRSLVLESSLKLLDDIQLVADAPARIQAATANKAWSKAVDILLEACNRLAREEMSKVGSLHKLRQDMFDTSTAIQGQLFEELHNRVYLSSRSSSSSTALLPPQQQQYRPEQQDFPQQQQQQQLYSGVPAGSSSSLRSRSDLKRTLACSSPLSLARTSPIAGLSPRAAAAAAGGREAASASIMPSFVMDALLSDAQDNGSSGSGKARAYGSSSGGGAAAAAAAANVAELVSCVMHLDALNEAKAYLLTNARLGIRQMLMQAVESWATTQDEQQQQQHVVDTGNSTTSSSSKQRHTAVSTATQQAVQRLLQSVFDSGLKALMNLGLLLQEVAAAQAAAAAAGSSAAKDSAAAAARHRGGAAAATAAAMSQSARASATAGLYQLKQQAAAAAAADPTAASSSNSPLRSAPSQTQGSSSPGSSGLSFISKQGLASPIAAAAAGSSGSVVHGSRSGFGSFGNLQGLAAGGALQGLSSSQQGLDLLRSSGVLNPMDPVDYVRVQIGHVWHEMQEEILLLLSELLKAPLQSSAAAAAGPAAAGIRQGGWLSDFAEIGDRAKSQLMQATGAGSSGGSTASAAGSSSPAAAAAGGGGSPLKQSPGIPGGSSGSISGLGPSYRGPRLTFSFDMTAVGMLLPAAAAGSHSASGVTGGPGMMTKESVGYGGLLRRGLGDAAMGPYLTPTVYLAVSNFVSDALIVIQDASPSAIAAPSTAAAAAAAESSAAASSSSSSGGVRPSTPPPTTPPSTLRNSIPSPLGKPLFASNPSRSDQGLGPQQQQQQQGLVMQLSPDVRLTSTWLKQSIEDYVMHGFLPQVWVDLRGRCTATLEDPEAFTPQITTNITNVTGYKARSKQGHLAFSAFVGGSNLAAAAGGSNSSSSSGFAGIRAPPRCAVAAAGFACHVLSEVVAWLPAVPVSATTTLAGVLDSILSHVLKALAWQASTALTGFKAGKLALNPTLALIMATEPDAVLLSPQHSSTFYIPQTTAAAAAAAGSSSSVGLNPGSADGELGFAVWAESGGFDLEGFNRALKAEDKPLLIPHYHRCPPKLRGLGLEGPSAATEVLLYCYRQRPAAADQVVAAAKPSGLLLLVALGESCEWVAENLDRMAAAAATGAWLGRHRPEAAAAAAGRSISPSRRGRSSSPLKGGSRRSPGKTAAAAAGSSEAAAAAAVSDTLQQLADKYRSLCGACVRAVRVDLLLLVAHQLHDLAAVSHACEEEDVMEVHPCIGGLIRLVSRAAEEMAPHLGQKKLNYVLGAVAGAAAHILMWVLQEIPEINANGVERMVRSLALMQGQLTNLGVLPAAAGAPGGAAAAAPAAAAMPAGGAAEVSQAYDRAKSYYTLVGLPADEVVRLAADKPGRYSLAEWEALLQVQVPGRVCGEKHMHALHSALDKYYHITAGQKVADFFEGVGRSVQEPVQKISTGVTAGLKGGFVQAKALLNKAAEAVQEAAAAAKHKPSAGGDKET